ncbi:SH3 domain-containing protein [Telluribacter sp. SYSU D00476]|uniref:SH3 domain-containing protein n=1 Tax=Telluribacter sp. SYSU D00476 TaxID=2811430 RepID=UPI001FF6D5DF|nr:SH3 domain-containing protein [Telluribacter sp. SYSU D00476]
MALIGALLLHFTPILAQENNLKVADSLFTIGRYSDAKNIYENYFQNHKKYNPNLLLKLAFLSERANDYTQSLYYLSNLAQLEPTVPLLKKMNSLAETHGLRGYEFNDYSYFVIFYRRYGEFLPILLLTLGVYVFVVMLIKIRNGEYIYKRHKWAMVIYLVALLGLLNAPANYSTGIISNGTTYLRSYPSSAAPVVERVSKGHKLTIIGARDNWNVVFWGGELVYVRKNDLMVI